MSERKILSNKIYTCNCKPYFLYVDYCKNCQEEVISFMNEHGAGVLMGDMIIEDLRKINQTLTNKNLSLRKQLQGLIVKINSMEREDDRHKKDT